ncbi:hypothetical protein MSAN_01004000 [Mycena sanguinolenta]|uniref:Uncharacterized protein n=1 Tax=Mycena sanguinolenta TaxID=230812 RepID=A0A8H6YRI2_9AGAR|nr:hypothetical protein MSAN_01004000 [Mycena sanguinolenta]
MAARLPNIQTTDFGTYDAKISVEVASPRTPLTPTSSFPSFRISSSSDRPQLSEKLQSSSSKIRDESRKLLVYILERLKNRTLPPPIYAAFATVQDDISGSSFAAIAQTVRGVVKMRAGPSGRPEVNPPSNSAMDDEGDEDDDGGIFSTDTTLELLTQLRDVLIISAAQGWQIFDEGYGACSNFQLLESLNAYGVALSQKLVPTSPAFGSAFEIAFAGGSREITRAFVSMYFHRGALILDVAQFLLHIHNHDPKRMQGRLLAFFEDGVIRKLLENLERARGPSTNSSVASHDDEHTPGMISIRVDEVQDERNAAPAGPYGWVPWSSSTTSSLSLHSTNTPFQTQSVYYLSSLIPPLLAAVLESVDVVAGSESRVDVIHRFYRLVDVIVTAKPDAYLDVLEVAAYHTPAKRSAMSLLATFWPKAIGHPVVGKTLPTILMRTNSSPGTSSLSAAHFRLVWRTIRAIHALPPSKVLASCAHFACVLFILGATTTLKELKRCHTRRTKMFNVWQPFGFLTYYPTDGTAEV